VDGELSDAYQLRMPTGEMPDVEVDEEAIIDASDRLEYACCSQRSVRGNLMEEMEETGGGIREGGKGYGCE
jgi:hypothetical protein